MNSTETFELINKSFHENKNSHAFLFVTNNIDRTMSDIKNLLKQINCKNSCNEDKPCTVCNLIENGTNPDIIYVEPDGKQIKVDQVETIINKFTTNPFISKYSSYVINHADMMNEQSANKLLKFLEEPVGSIIGFFVTDNLERVITTIKSRCEIYQLYYENLTILDYLNIDENTFDKFFNETMKLLTYLNEDKKYLLMSKSSDFSKYERADLDIVFKLLYNMYVIKYKSVTEGLNIDYLKPIIDTIVVDDVTILVKRINLLDNVIRDFRLNVNKDLFINKFMMEWE